MPELFRYRDENFFCHHTLTEHPDPSSFSMHAHDKCEILYIISGRCAFNVEGRAYPVTPGDIFITRAAETHRISVNPDTPYERCAVHFPAAMIESLGFGTLLAPFTDRPLGVLNRYGAVSFASPMYASCITGICSGTPDKTRMTAYLLAFLAELSPAFSGAGIPGSAEKAGNPDRPENPGAMLVDYVNRRLFGELSLGELGRHFYMSKNSINRLFRQATGTTVGEYIRIKRLLAARERIKAGDFASDAASSCGFGDYSAFFRAYKNQFGKSPHDDTPEKG